MGERQILPRQTIVMLSCSRPLIKEITLMFILQRFLNRLQATFNFIRLFGTAYDRAITSAIAAGFGPRVQDLAGRTNLD